jgi:uncharacterized protein YfaS (alpha-2-macroglobulin family)
MPYDSASASRSVQVLAYKVDFSVNKNYVRPGETLTLTVKTYADSSPASVNIKVMLVLGTFTGTLFTGTTDGTGTWTKDWTVPYRVTCPEGTVYLPCNKVSLYAMLAQSPYTSSPSVDVYFIHPTRLTLATDKDKYAPGETVVATAKLEWQREDGSWAPLGPDYTIVFSLDGQAGSSKTDSNGVASYTFKAPSASGTYTVKATFAGAGLAAASVAEVAVKAAASFSASPIAPAVAGAILMALSLLKMR